MEDSENDAIVADYFAMLAKDVAQVPYNKAEHNRALQSAIGRQRGSIEFKHQNISAVLKALGEVWILGYKPAFNFQGSLVDAVARYLAHNGDWNRAYAVQPTRQLQEVGVMYLDAAPTLRNAPEPVEAEQLNAIARRLNVAERDDRNRLLGEAGGRRALAHERAALITARRDDLAKQVRWVSKEDGDGAGYDIASFESDGTPRLIEVKTTNGWDRTPFHITRNELAVSEANTANWLVLRIWNFARTPRAFELRPPLSRHVDLVATSYQARFH